MASKEDILFAVVPPSDSWLPNLGIACLKSYLEEKGITAAFADLNISFVNTLPEAERKTWVIRTDEQWRDARRRARFFRTFRKGIEGLVDEVLSHGARLLGFHVHSLNCGFAVELARCVKRREPGRVILFGGPGVTDPALRKSLPPFVDHCVVNEGEITVEEVCTAFESGGDISKVAGVHTNLSGGMVAYRPRHPRLIKTGILLPSICPSENRQTTGMGANQYL